MTGPGRERPILFQGAMVRAIRAGQKTQTRRIVKLPPLRPWQLSNSKGWHFIECNHSMEDCNNFIAGFGDGIGSIVNIKCPYGKPAHARFGLPADRLWVRETHRYWFPDWIDPPAYPCKCRYKADNFLVELPVEWEEGCQFSTPEDAGLDIEPTKWRPSIFMPRWASRITLEITAVRVERLQNISEADARAEGICELSLQQGEPGAWWTADPKNPDIAGRTAVCAYRKLWEKIHGPGSWDINPYVWVVEFRQVAPSNQPTATEP